jgi:hypothetical protein
MLVSLKAIEDFVVANETYYGVTQINGEIEKGAVAKKPAANADC